MKIAFSTRLTQKVADLRNISCPRKAPMVLRFSSNQTDTKWSGNISFASPESDFVSVPKISNSISSSSTKWSGNLSFASPESDFVAASETKHLTRRNTRTDPTWSDNLSFASPESDFASASKTVHLRSTESSGSTWSKSLSFASPESDFVAASEKVHSGASQSGNGAKINSTFDELFQTHHLYISPETATGSIAYSEMLDKTTKDAIMERLLFKTRLPKTMKDALNDERPIVVTTVESPTRVVDVNCAWERLCGYRRDEAIGRDVASLLQGPETDIEKANDTVRLLRENGFSEMILINYTKTGRKFENHLKIGVMSANHNSNATSSSEQAYFVGVLQEVNGKNENRAPLE